MNTSGYDLDVKFSPGNKMPVPTKAILSSEILGISITMISLMIIFSPFATSNSINFDQWEFSEFMTSLINSEQSIMAGDSKIITKIIDGKPYSITVKLVVEQKINPISTY